MKKFMKFIFIIIGLPLIYFLICILTNAVIVSICYITNIYNNIKIPTINEFLIIDISNLIMFIFLMLIFAGTKKSLFKRCRFNNLKIKKIIYISIFTITMSFFVAFLIAILLFFFPSYFISYRNVNTFFSIANNSIINLLTVLVFVPIFEEIFFRGVIFNFLRNNFNLKVSIIGQALIFSICHGNLLQIIYTFFSGIFFASIYIYTDSIYGSIISHIIFNVFGIIIIPYLSKTFPEIIIFIFIILICSSLIILKKIKRIYI